MPTDVNPLGWCDLNNAITGSEGASLFRMKQPSVCFYLRYVLGRHLHGDSKATADLVQCGQKAHEW